MTCKFPNYFILGAPKCGTTSLFTYICEHENVLSCSVKEPNFFNSEIDVCQVSNQAEYEALFKKAGPDSLAAGDASVWYFYSPNAIPNILEYNLDAKFIVMLRSPVAMLTSLHHFYQVQFVEPETDFRKAWAIQDKRWNGEIPIPKNPLQYTREFYNYREIGKLGKHLQRIMKQISNPDNLLVLFFDDLKKDPRAVYEKTLDFLGLPQNGRSDFPHYNVRRGYYWQKLARKINVVYGILSRGRRKFGIKSPTNIWPIFDRLLTAKQNDSPKLCFEFQQKLIDEFREDIKLLESLTSTDLKHWLVAPQIPTS